MIGFVLLSTLPKFLHPGVSSGGARFSGTVAQARLAMAILGLVELFGVIATLYGLWQIVTGRRSMWVIYFTVGFGVLLLLCALLI